MSGKEQATTPTATDGTNSSSPTREERAKEGWKKTLNRVGVPPRHRDAYWGDCEIYGDDPDKRPALNAALRFSGKDGSEPGKIEERDVERFALVLLGEYGTGKTHLATAAFKHVLYNLDKKSGIWSKFYDFIRKVQSTYSAAAETTVQKVLGQYQNTSVLLLDDVGDLKIQEQTEDRRRLLYEVLDTRNDKMLPTIITTNLSPKQFKTQFGERTLERVAEMAAFYRMDGRNYRTDPVTEQPDPNA